MTQKKLVFDVVFSSGDESVFELRFKKLYDIVDYFLIFGTEESLKKIERYYSQNDSKIKIFVVELPLNLDSENEKSISTTILNTITELYGSFEDLIFFSFSYEIYDLLSLNEVDIKAKDVNFLLCDVFEGNFDRKRKHSELGSVLVNFSHLLKNKKSFFHEIFNSKLNKKTHDLGIKNGFKILNFTKSIDKLPNHYKCPFSDKFIEYKFERVDRKFCFFCDIDIHDVVGDYIFKLKFINKFPEQYSNDLNCKIQEFEIFIPENPLYFTDIEDFQSNYKINEIVKILFLFDCNDEDDVEIYSNDEIKKYKFREIKNPSL